MSYKIAITLYHIVSGSNIITHIAYKVTPSFLLSKYLYRGPVRHFDTWH